MNHQCPAERFFNKGFLRLGLRNQPLPKLSQESLLVFAHGDLALGFKTISLHSLWPTCEHCFYVLVYIHELHSFSAIPNCRKQMT
jgi:hypothetical protein